MSKTTVVNEIVIQTRPEILFDFVSSPGLWPRWHPSSRHLNIARDPEGPQKKGDTFSEDIQAGGRKGKLVWQVTVCDRPACWVATAESDQGASIGLRYDIAAVGEGVLFRRTLVYELRPLFLRIANLVFMKWKIRHESSAALRNLKALQERRAVP